MISEEIRNKIINDTKIVEVVGEYVSLTKKGNSYFGLCPFHDDHNASMSVSNERKVFKCFSCGVAGNVIKFVQKKENIRFEEACIKLGKRLGLEISPQVSKKNERFEKLYKIMEEAKNFYKFYLTHSEEGIVALEYLHKRNITDDIIEKFEIGLAPKSTDILYKFLKEQGFLEFDLNEIGLISENSRGEGYHDVYRERIMFPLKNQYSRTVGFSGRIYTNSDQAKYINSKETPIFHKSDVLYNFNFAQDDMRKFDKVYIMEGFMDVIAAYKAGITNCVAAMGTALTQKHVSLILSLTKNIVLCFDGDFAGINAMKKSSALLLKNNIIPESIVLPDNLDPDEYLNKYGKEQLVNYFSTKTLPVYTQIYNLNKKDLNLSDIRTIENFKTNVFDFLIDIEIESMVSFYINELSRDINVTSEVLFREFNNYKASHKRHFDQNQGNNNQTYQNNNNNYNNDYNFDNNNFDYGDYYSDNLNNPDNSFVQDTNNNPDNSNTKTNTKKNTKKGFVACKRAYEYVIYYAMMHKDFAKKILRETDSIYPGLDFDIEYQIIKQIIELERYFYNGLTSGTLVDYVRETLLLNDEFNPYITNIISNEVYKKYRENDAEECLNTIVKYLKQVRLDILNKLIKEGNTDCYEEYIKLKSEISK